MNGYDQADIVSEASSPEYGRSIASTTLKDDMKGENQGDVVPDQNECIPLNTPEADTKGENQVDIVPDQNECIPLKTPEADKKVEDQGDGMPDKDDCISPKTPEADTKGENQVDVVPDQNECFPLKTLEADKKVEDQGDGVPDKDDCISPKTPEAEKSYVRCCKVLSEEIASNIMKLCPPETFQLIPSDEIENLSKQCPLLVLGTETMLNTKSGSGNKYQSEFNNRKYPDKKHSKPRQPLKPSRVQFFVPIETATTKDFPNAIKDLVQDISIKYILCSGISDLGENSPLVVVCPISSRLEPDIDSSIDGIKWNKTFVVLLLHSCLESSLPRLPTASKVGHKEKYKNIVFIDIAYTIDEKLYWCQMNEIAKAQLTSFLHHFTISYQD